MLLDPVRWVFKQQQLSYFFTNKDSEALFNWVLVLAVGDCLLRVQLAEIVLEAALFMATAHQTAPVLLSGASGKTAFGLIRLGVA